MLTWTALARITIIAALPLLVLPQLPAPGILLALFCAAVVLL